MMKKSQKEPEEEIDEVKVVVIGSGGSGKSCLTNFFLTGIFTESYDPTIEDSYVKKVIVDGEPVVLDILDTAGQEEYTAMLSQYLKTGQGFLLVYSVIDKSSFNDVAKFKTRLWAAKDKEVGDTVPLVLVGNKVDLEDERVIPTNEGQDLATQYKCIFAETSAKTGKNVHEIFHELVREVRRDRKAKGYTLQKTTAPSEESLKKKLARKFGKWGFFTKIFGRKKEEKKPEPKKEERRTTGPAQTPVTTNPSGDNNISGPFAVHTPFAKQATGPTPGRPSSVILTSLTEAQKQEQHKNIPEEKRLSTAPSETPKPEEVPPPPPAETPVEEELEEEEEEERRIYNPKVANIENDVDSWLKDLDDTSNQVNAKLGIVDNQAKPTTTPTPAPAKPTTTPTPTPAPAKTSTQPTPVKTSTPTQQPTKATQPAPTQQPTKATQPAQKIASQPAQVKPSADTYGKIPKKFDPIKQLETYPWFHGNMSGSEADSILTDKPVGTFLIRFSSQNGFLAASYVDAQAVQRCLIAYDNTGFWLTDDSITEIEKYPSLQELVDAFSSVFSVPYVKPQTKPATSNYNTIPKVQAPGK